MFAWKAKWMIYWKHWWSWCPANQTTLAEELSLFHSSHLSFFYFLPLLSVFVSLWYSTYRAATQNTPPHGGFHMFHCWTCMPKTQVIYRAWGSVCAYLSETVVSIAGRYSWLSLHWSCSLVVKAPNLWTQGQRLHPLKGHSWPHIKGGLTVHVRVGGWGTMWTSRAPSKEDVPGESKWVYVEGRIVARAEYILSWHIV